MARNYLITQSGYRHWTEMKRPSNHLSVIFRTAWMRLPAWKPTQWKYKPAIVRFVRRNTTKACLDHEMEKEDTYTMNEDLIMVLNWMNL